MAEHSTCCHREMKTRAQLQVSSYGDGTVQLQHKAVKDQPQAAEQICRALPQQHEGVPQRVPYKIELMQ